MITYIFIKECIIEVWKDRYYMLDDYISVFMFMMSIILCPFIPTLDIVFLPFELIAFILKKVIDKGSVNRWK